MNETIERQVDLTLPMIPDIEITAAKAAAELAREIGLSPDQIDEMAHAVVEACINAREHSCCVDQRIYLRFVGSSSERRPKLEVWITDHGRGFDPQEARLRRTQPADAPKKRGWGLQIMEAHMDEVDIRSSPEGTTVHMVKYGESTQS